MAENPNTGSDRHLLEGLEQLGSGTAFADQVFSMVGHSQFFADFTYDDIKLLAGYMNVYRVQPGQTVIREGDIGDYMLMIIDGEIDIFKRNLMGEPQHITVVTPGMTLGEMSMIDGEPRFATCVAVTEGTFGVLTRDNMVKIILEKPSVGAKILIKLVTLLSQRLRHTSAMLLQYMK
jgi:CRP/FNR family cyclic AMP-dependent transcriptional regulator